MHTFKLNGQSVSVDVEDDMPLLWVLRDELGHTGTKFGCGVAACGACTVHIDGTAMRSCSIPVSFAGGKAVQTIEAKDDPVLKRLQSAWITHQVPQCGSCQSGMLMAARNSRLHACFSCADAADVAEAAAWMAARTRR